MNKLTAIGALAFACASFPAHADNAKDFLRGIDVQELWFTAATVLVVSMLIFHITRQLKESNKQEALTVKATEKDIRRSIEKYPELRLKIQKHLEERGALTKNDLTVMVEEIENRKASLAQNQEDEDERQKQLDFLNKDL
ncbi:hypothetical protein ACLPHM_02710 [Paenalcaligenes sp. Me131]|uniref:hypothetical protein n=1 Tax=Paenalcaligenes sp. Me131 TaxID=3392636 RepID=UPI003D29C42A